MNETSGPVAEAAPGTPADPTGLDLMGRELAEGPEAVEATLQQIARLRSALDEELSRAARVVLIGTGASLVAAHIAAPEWRRRAARGGPQGTGVAVRQSSDAVLGSLDGESFRPADVVIAISQSGSSPETVAAASAARAAGATVVALTARSETPLSDAAALTVLVGSGVERSAATKSALATVAGLFAIEGSLLVDRDSVSSTSARLRDVLAQQADAESAGRILAGAERLWWLGYGMGLGVAEAGTLLWHEKVVRQATAATPSEFRHGLIEAAREHGAVALIEIEAPDPRRDAYLAQMRAELGRLDVPLVGITTSAAEQPPLRALEALLRVQQIARAAAMAAGTYREDFAVLRNVVTPATSVFQNPDR